MPGLTNTIKVMIVGEDKSGGKSMKAFGKDLATLHGRLGLFGKALESTFTGKFSKAQKQFGALSKAGQATGGMFGFLTKTAAAVGSALPYIGFAAVAVIGAFTGLAMAAKNVIDQFASWAGQAAQMSRVTGMASAASSQLLGVFQLLGVDSTKVGTSIAMFTKNLGLAQLGGKAQAAAFKLLHIGVKGLTAAQALPMVASKLRDIGSASIRGAIASKLFGRSWKDLSKYILASNGTLSEAQKFVKSLGLQMGPKAMRTFAAYHKAQERMGLAWFAVKANAGRALMPIATVFLKGISKWIAQNMPKINKDFQLWGNFIQTNVVPPLKRVAGYIAAFAMKLIDPKFQKVLIDVFTRVKDWAASVATSLASVAKSLASIAKLAGAVGFLFTTPGTTSTTMGRGIPGSGGGAAGERGDVVGYAEKFLGVPYKWGGTTPAGFDCSGFTQYVYRHFGMNIPRTAAEQFAAGRAVSSPSLGDLLGFEENGTIGHIGMYAGGGKMIDSPHTGADVRIEGYEWPNYAGARTFMAAKGFEGIVNRATHFVAGEAGPEKVKITPTNGPGDGFQVHLHLEGAYVSDVGKFCREIEPHLTRAIATATRRDMRGRVR